MVSTRLKEGLLVSGSVISPSDNISEDAQLDHFGRLVDGLADEWQIWLSNPSEAYYARRIFQRRFAILIEAVLILIPSLRTNPSSAQQIRNAVFKIQSAQAYPYANRDYDEDGIVSKGIEELIQLASDLRLQMLHGPENHNGQTSTSAKEVPADDGN